MAAVEWLRGPPRRQVQWLGVPLPPPPVSPPVPRPTFVPQAPAGNTMLPATSQNEIQKVERGLTTTEKVVIASLFLQIIAFTWGIYKNQKGTASA